MSSRRAMMRAASASFAVASVFLLATCDLDKLTTPESGGTAPPLVDSTDLTLTGGTTVPLGGTATLNVTSATVSLTNVVKRFYSSQPTFVKIDSITGIMTGQAIGASTVRAVILAPELGAGVGKSQLVTTVYKGLRFTSPTPADSILGLGPTQNKTAIVFGTNNSNLNVLQITPDSLRSRDTTVFRVTGTTISGRKSGTAQLVAFFGTLRDSVAVRVRQVAKSITYPTSDYTARHLNFNVNVPLTVKDITDSVIVNPPLKWRTKDTTVAKVDSLTGVLRVKKVGTDTIWARMDTVERAQRIVVAQVVGSISKFAGDARTDTVALPVKILPQVTVLDSGSTPIVGASVLFKPGIGLNATVTDTLQTTDANGRAKPTAWKLGDLVGAQSLTATSGTQTATFTATAVAQRPKKLAFLVNPTSASVGVAISPAITVQVQDSLGNLITGANHSVTLSLNTNPGGATLTGTLTQAAVNGVATFNNLSLNNGGSGYTLQATAAGLTTGISNGFDIFGNPTKLGFTTQPVSTSQGATMSTVRVAVQDVNGNTVGNSSANITISFNANPGAATLGGTLTVQAVAGVAQFTTLSVNNAASGYTLQAASTGLTGAVSTAFNVAVVGAAAKLAFSVQPGGSPVVAGAAISPAVKVQVLDANGGLVTSASTQLTLAIESTSPTGATLSGTLPKNAVSGEATFSDLSINKAGTGFKLIASGTGGSSLTTATSAAFNVAPGAATRLAFVQQPTHTLAAATMAPAVTVEVQDASGNRVTTGATYSVSLALGVCSATLTGGGAQTTVNGLATFSGLSVATQVNGCTLTASATGLTPSGASTAFNSISASGASKLAFTTEPSAVMVANQALGGPPAVAIQDAAGNAVTTTSTPITLSILSGPQASFTSGTATVSTTNNTSFPGLVLRTAGSYRILASAPGFKTDTSQIITVSSGTATRVGFLTQPSSIVAGVPFSPAVVASVQDDWGNTIAGANNVVTLNVQLANPPGTSLRFNDNSFNYSVTASNGIATYSGLSVRTAGSVVKLNVFSTALSGATSTFFDVIPAPLSKLGFTVQPQNPATAGVALAPSIQVAGQDSVGNTISDFSNAVTLSLTGGLTGATLGGTKTQAPAAGVATFSNLTIDRPSDGYQLSASASGVSTGISNTFRTDPVFLTTCCSGYNDHVVLGSTLYFVGGGALKSVPLAGGAITTIAGSTNATKIATDGTHIYWSENGATNSGDAFIKKLTLPAGTVSTLTVALTNLTETVESKIHSDGVNVYFIARNVPGNGYAIRSVPVGAVGASPTDLFTNNNFNPPIFLRSGGFIYFIDPSTGTIRRMTTGGASLTTLSTGSQTALRFAMSGTTLYYNDGVTIKSIPNAPSAVGPVTPTNVITASGTVYEIAADGTNLYFNFDGTVRRYSTSNFSVFADLMVTNPSANQFFFPITLDGTHLYVFTNFGRIVKFPK